MSVDKEVPSGLNGDNVEGTGNDARVALLNAINDANDGVRAEELAHVNDDGSTEAFTVEHANGVTETLTDESVKDPVAETEIQRMADEIAEEPPQEAAPAAPAKIKIKVNGREMELTQEELIARAQKVEAADQYLAESSRILRENQAKLVQQPAAQPEQPEAADDDLAIARAIQMGTEEEAVAALRKIRQATPSLSKDDIAKTIDERLTFKEAYAKFCDTYSDIVGDPVLDRLAKDTDAKLLAAGDQRSYWDRYKDIGDTLRDWMKKQIAAHTPVSPKEQGAEKLQKKAAATPIPKSASTKTASSVEEEKEPSPSEIIAAIAQARGGPQWMQGVARH